jgi:hypothetical protein
MVANDVHTLRPITATYGSTVDYSDVATQSTWPIVLRLKTIVVSAATTKSLCLNPDATTHADATGGADTIDRAADQNQSRVIAWAGKQITATHSHANTDRATDDHAHTQSHSAAPRDPSGGAQR